MNELASNFQIGQWIQVNDQGYIPYNMGELVIVSLSFSTVVVDMHYTMAGKKQIERNIHIPYEHIKQ